MSLTITRQFHSTRRRDGRHHLNPGPAPNTPKGKIPRITRLMALAIHCDTLLRTRQIPNQSALANHAHITPARLTQILTLLNLAPDIQEQILLLPRTTKGTRGDPREGHPQDRDGVGLEETTSDVGWTCRRMRRVNASMGLNHGVGNGGLARLVQLREPPSRPFHASSATARLNGRLEVAILAYSAKSGWDIFLELLPAK